MLPLSLQQRCGPCSFWDGKAFRAARTRPSRPLAQTVSVIPSLVVGLRLPPSAGLPATDCAVPHASASLRPASIQPSLPVRVEGCTPLQLPATLTRWAVPAQAGEAVCPPTASVSSAVPGSPRSPFHGAPEPSVPHASRPPPRPRSTAFRALGHWETLRRASASRSVLTPTASPAPPSRLRDSQQPRPTRGTTPEPQC